MSIVAWTLTDNEQATPVVYHFEVNPKVDQGSFGVQKGIHYGVSAGPGGATVVHEGPDGRGSGVVSCQVLSEAASVLCC